MFELPWSDESFDVVTAINGIWGDCQGAVDEAYRVTRPGGRVGVSFWGNGKPFDLKVGGETISGTTSPDGRLIADVPAGHESGEVTIWLDDDKSGDSYTWPIRISEVSR